MKKHYREGKEIIKRDISHLAFIDSSHKREIDQDIEDCLVKQQSEIDEIIDDINYLVKSKFESIYDFQVFLIRNMEFK